MTTFQLDDILFKCCIEGAGRLAPKTSRCSSGSDGWRLHPDLAPPFRAQQHPGARPRDNQRVTLQRSCASRERNCTVHTDASVLCNGSTTSISPPLCAHSAIHATWPRITAGALCCRARRRRRRCACKRSISANKPSLSRSAVCARPHDRRWAWRCYVVSGRRMGKPHETLKATHRLYSYLSRWYQG